MEQEALAPFASVSKGLIDLDSHEGIPFHLWNEHFGDLQERWQPLVETAPGEQNVIAGQVCAKDPRAGDAAPLDPDNVWVVKGAGAPGTIDMGRRLEVMDAMGVERQLVFPGMGLFGMFFAFVSPGNARRFLGKEVPAGVDLKQLGHDSVRAHNDWVIRQMRRQEGGSPRLRPAAILIMDTVENTMTELARAAEGGARAVFMRSAAPPCGMPPADRRLDPFWRYLEDRNIPATLHIGGDSGFLDRVGWCGIPEFAPPPDYHSLEFPGFDPYTGAACHYANENFLQALLLGGIFKRFPDLRFGVIETGASWVGPLAERMDSWCELYPRQAAQVLDARPSEYLNHNVRVTPFYFENVRGYFERFPQLENVYAFASDYPHPEGGKNVFARLATQLAPLGEEVSRKFFRDNGLWLVPD